VLRQHGVEAVVAQVVSQVHGSAGEMGTWYVGGSFVELTGYSALSHSAREPAQLADDHRTKLQNTSQSRPPHWLDP